MAAQMLEWRQRNKTQITYKYGEQRHIKTMKKTMKMTQLLNTKQRC